MTRRMSVALTIPQVRAHTKTVTRRHHNTWTRLQAGDRLLLIEKGQGLPQGEQQVVICEVEVVDVRVEPLGLVDAGELVAEGFPDSNPGEWRHWWAAGHGWGRHLDPALVDDVPCRRIEWRYLDEATA